MRSNLKVAMAVFAVVLMLGCAVVPFTYSDDSTGVSVVSSGNEDKYTNAGAESSGSILEGLISMIENADSDPSIDSSKINDYFGDLLTDFVKSIGSRLEKVADSEVGEVKPTNSRLGANLLFPVADPTDLKTVQPIDSVSYFTSNDKGALYGTGTLSLSSNMLVPNGKTIVLFPLNNGVSDYTYTITSEGSHVIKYDSGAYINIFGQTYRLMNSSSCKTIVESDVYELLDVSETATISQTTVDNTVTLKIKLSVDGRLQLFDRFCLENRSDSETDVLTLTYKVGENKITDVNLKIVGTYQDYVLDSELTFDELGATYSDADKKYTITEKGFKIKTLTCTERYGGEKAFMYLNIKNLAVDNLTIDYVANASSVITDANRTFYSNCAASLTLSYPTEATSVMKADIIQFGNISAPKSIVGDADDEDYFDFPFVIYTTGVTASFPNGAALNYTYATDANDANIYSCKISLTGGLNVALKNASFAYGEPDNEYATLIFTQSDKSLDTSNGLVFAVNTLKFDLEIKSLMDGEKGYSQVNYAASVDSIKSDAEVITIETVSFPIPMTSTTIPAMKAVANGVSNEISKISMTASITNYDDECGWGADQDIITVSATIDSVSSSFASISVQDVPEEKVAATEPEYKITLETGVSSISGISLSLINDYKAVTTVTDGTTLTTDSDTKVKFTVASISESVKKGTMVYTPKTTSSTTTLFKTITIGEIKADASGISVDVEYKQNTVLVNEEPTSSTMMVDAKLKGVFNFSINGINNSTDTNLGLVEIGEIKGSLNLDIAAVYDTGKTTGVMGIQNLVSNTTASLSLNSAKVSITVAGTETIIAEVKNFSFGIALNANYDASVKDAVLSPEIILNLHFENLTVGVPVQNVTLKNVSADIVNLSVSGPVSFSTKDKAFSIPAGLKVKADKFEITGDNITYAVSNTVVGAVDDLKISFVSLNVDTGATVKVLDKDVAASTLAVNSAVVKATVTYPAMFDPYKPKIDASLSNVNVLVSSDNKYYTASGDASISLSVKYDGLDRAISVSVKGLDISTDAYAVGEGEEAVTVYDHIYKANTASISIDVPFESLALKIIPIPLPNIKASVDAKTLEVKMADSANKAKSRITVDHVSAGSITVTNYTAIPYAPNVECESVTLNSANVDLKAPYDISADSISGYVKNFAQEAQTFTITEQPVICVDISQSVPSLDIKKGKATFTAGFIPLGIIVEKDASFYATALSAVNFKFAYGANIGGRVYFNTQEYLASEDEARTITQGIENDQEILMLIVAPASGYLDNCHYTVAVDLPGYTNGSLYASNGMEIPEYKDEYGTPYTRAEDQKSATFVTPIDGAEFKFDCVPLAYSFSYIGGEPVEKKYLEEIALADGPAVQDKKFMGWSDGSSYVYPASDLYSMPARDVVLTPVYADEKPTVNVVDSGTAKASTTASTEDKSVLVSSSDIDKVGTDGTLTIKVEGAKVEMNKSTIDSLENQKKSGDDLSLILTVVKVTETDDDLKQQAALQNGGTLYSISLTTEDGSYFDYDGSQTFTVTVKVACDKNASGFNIGYIGTDGIHSVGLKSFVQNTDGTYDVTFECNHFSDYSVEPTFDDHGNGLNMTWIIILAVALVLEVAIITFLFTRGGKQ